MPLLLALALLLAAPVGFSSAEPASARAHVSKRARVSKPSITRFTSTPSALPASGGPVHLRVVVRGAARCRFWATTRLAGLPSSHRCATGSSSVTVSVPANKLVSPRTFAFDVTATGAHGASTTRGVRVAQRAAAVAPVITTQPTSQTVAAGALATFTAAASGVPAPSVQWQLSTDGGSAWTSVPGANSTSYSISAQATESGYEYRANFTNTGGTATTSAAILTVAPDSTTRFAGYIAFAPTGESFTAAGASWTVPAVSCPSGANTWTVQWPGIGAGTSVVQDGTQEECSDGVPIDTAWYELVGDAGVNDGNPVTLSTSLYPVDSGDAISASVSISGSTWTLALADTTQKWHFTFTTPSPTPALGQSAAQWVDEGPEPGSSYGLANFGAVNFSGATAELNGGVGSISAFAPIAEQMVSGSTVRAAPGPLDPTGEDFTDTWRAN